MTVTIAMKDPGATVVILIFRLMPHPYHSFELYIQVGWANILHRVPQNWNQCVGQIASYLGIHGYYFVRNLL